MCKYTKNIEKHALKPKLFTQSRTKPNHNFDCYFFSFIGRWTLDALYP